MNMFSLMPEAFWARLPTADEVACAYVAQVYRRTGSLARAAALVGISVQTARRRVRAYHASRGS